MDWDKLKTFHAAAETGSLTAAAEQLGISQSAVSRQIQALEESLGVSLFHRHARGLLLTEQGNILRNTTAGMNEQVVVAEARLRDSRDRPFGPLRVTAPVAFGSIWLTPRLVRFKKDYPDIILHMLYSDSIMELNLREADCAIRLGRPEQPDVVQRKLIRFPQSLYASRDYVGKHGEPKTLADLDHHPIVLYGAGGAMQRVDWLRTLGRENGVARDPSMTIDNIYALKKAISTGAGIAGLPDYVTAEHEDLVRVLPDYHGPPIDLYFAYPEELRRSKRLQAFSEFLTTQLKKWEG